MIRRLLTRASALSLVLCVATVGLWAYSHRRQASAYLYVQNMYVMTVHRPGVATFEITVYRHALSPPPGRWGSWTDDVEQAQWSRFGFDLRAYGDLDGTRYVVAFPFWFLAALTGLPAAALCVRAARRRLRRRPGCCRTCGYDLRASEGRCPECGMPIQSETHGKATA